ncbi:hypothetical protein MVLG_06746 [Microbotryum lychnidis-dioicae p1A1 Lamole]|uniref:ATP-dependent DNA helicase n=1 Tax=Microbotryum lychnidis-dioicae (strain p1A1 Lamole / MvSl-1064) TaxID=683840 RepID=U5HI82_USTV1|nr:hypothetical protein MVLG_06746 [Microbotryum lychnidis-dioicae p1A1 Lamole]|eukprot:KDE02715.1 hypothetical protein MVLG_06746 [Microbotryum lychnidis-dioicae p1A1 Lamole]
MAHSRFKIPIDIFNNSMCNVPKQEQLVELWDEVPMQHRQCFQLVDRMLQHVRLSTAQFGGLTVVLAGDKLMRSLALHVPFRAFTAPLTSPPASAAAFTTVDTGRFSASRT